MFEDRYLPADDPEDYELNRGEERKESSRHKHDSSSKHKKKSHHRERSSSRERSHKRHKERKEPSPDEVEDGEVLEDGEIAEAAADGLNAPEATAAEAAAVDDAATANGKHRSSEDDSAEQNEGKERQSSKPPSRRSSSRERSKDKAADKTADKAARGSSRDRKSSRERKSSRDGSKDPRDKDNERSERSKERSRERSSRRARESDGLQQQRREREQGRSRHSSRERPAAAAGDRYQRGSDSSRQYERDRDRDKQCERDRELRQYDRDRSERDGRYRSERDRRDRPYDMGSSRDDRGGRRRSSRSRSGGRRGQDYERDRDRYSKRGRDERDREESKRRRRHSSDSEPELELDPTALLEGDALGLTAAQKEEEEQQRRLEESRRRRQEILAKHQQAAAVAAPTATAAAAAAAEEPAAGGATQQQQQQQQGEAGAEQQPVAAAQSAAAAEDDGIATPEGERTSSEDSHNAPGSPVMDIWNQGAAAAGEVSSRAAGGAGPDDEQPTSQLPVHMVLPGTEPNMQSERLRVGLGAAKSAAAAAAGDAKSVPETAAAATAAGDGKGDAADAAAGGGDDMFAAEDDMFAAEGAEGAGAALRRGPAVPAGLTDNYDDAEGYYNFQVGELLDARYEVFACKGKGVFSTVLRARDLARQVSSTTGQLLPGVGPGPLAPGAEHPEVAIKVIRSNETMSKAAALEQRILRLLADKDPDNRKHCIRLLRTFEYRQHVCMVFEPLDMNLRELTLKYGRNVGLNITAVAIYAGQLLVALRHLQQCRVLHADIKPDNILVNARRSKVKICDLGSAMLAGENERTPYLVSRFYRAPEVILGLAYDFPMDMWSVGCVLYELFTGKILFPGRSNNEMLKLMMDVKGPFPKKMLKKGIFVEKHFEDDTSMSFALVEEDPVTKQPIRRVIPNPTVKHNFSQLLARAEGDRAQVAALADLLEKMLALDPDKRLQPDAALRHPFVKPWLPKKKGAAGAAAH